MSSQILSHPAALATLAASAAPSFSVVPKPETWDAGVETRQVSDLSVAVVHDWCPSFRGGERVLSALCRIFPKNDVYTLFDFLEDSVKDEFFPNKTFYTSPANSLPFIKKYYRSLFFACPFLIEQFDVTGYDAVISSSAAFARGVITHPDQPHLCYVHSPARYAWDEQFSYLNEAKLGFGPKGLLYRMMLHHLRTWDTRTANGPDMMLANSEFVRRRIRQVYGRDARVVHPPVDLNESVYGREKDDYYVTASFLAPYKRTDLVVEAFRTMPHRRLVVVGEGQQSKKLRAMSAPNITYTGYLPRQDYLETVARAKALIFAGCEDFGIALAEAQASGTPVIAFARGGAVDIVRPLGKDRQPTGILFREQTTGDIQAAVERFDDRRHEIRAENCRLNAQRFSVQRFDTEIAAAFADVLEQRASV
ncbi:glycosyltransferase [Methylobacterium goesingense]|nr:glycosyltransferase [Methylobacterium goesingense]